MIIEIVIIILLTNLDTGEEIVNIVRLLRNNPTTVLLLSLSEKK